ncbi:hypothetical protein BN12_320025 [Nostocoides japonicum T1-X7]|uniref:Uncharacterized protein n=1 Tax=Nostocoides japonicum T1-X7 TaxID=1194083 RepID=A0A077M3I2_9MICO|nr:hypothetical protein BN12_1870003 [Tetrasphaera japonica T1-X7]CCH78690.1 hypothetical protein BN12_320025 [Tetrasphaera japonica T1-X7]
MVASTGSDPRAPIGNRTLDLFLTMETLCRLSYWGLRPIGAHTGPRPLRETTRSGRMR